MECTGRGLALGYGARALTMAWEAAMLAFTRRSVEEILVTDPYTGYQIGVAPIDYGMTRAKSALKYPRLHSPSWAKGCRSGIWPPRP